jgi:hypothetical protein
MLFNSLEFALFLPIVNILYWFVANKNLSAQNLLINNKSISESVLFNASVSWANLKDIIDIYQIYKNENKLPKKILVGIDPEYFMEVYTEERWKSINYLNYEYHNVKEKIYTNN